MTREEILKRFIANEISGEDANSIIYNALLLLSWIEMIALENNPDFYVQVKPILDSFRESDKKVESCLVLTNLLAKSGIAASKSPVQTKAKKDNIIAFPPWGIKMK